VITLRYTSLVVLILAAAACRPSRPAVGASADGSGNALPAIAGFVAGPETSGASYQRRSYARDGETTTVTLARFPMSAEQYQGWLRMSTADFPQARLDLDGSEGNGFYQCAEGDPSRCNLLVQLRCGLHLEIRGQGTARRRDSDDVLRALDLPTLAKRCE
jgi:hypothetical protein